MTRIDDAYRLIDDGQPEQGIACLQEGGRTGDPACLIELGVWYLEGRLVQRDLRSARDSFRAAGELGDATAEHVYICLLANGTGGEADWSAATARLERLASNDAQARHQLTLLAAMSLDHDGFPVEAPAADPISKSPAVSQFRSFASADECRYLIEVAAARLQPSVIVDPGSGELRPHPVRTSDGAMFPLVAEDLVIGALNKRIAAASGTAYECGEPLQVLRYQPGQEYRPHFDALPAGDNQRVATMLLYLNEGYAGGETRFTETGLTFRGAVGDALLFWNALPDGRPDPLSRHAGLPVTSGEKFLATRWIRARSVLPV